MEISHIDTFKTLESRKQDQVIFKEFIYENV